MLIHTSTRLLKYVTFKLFSFVLVIVSFKYENFSLRLFSKKRIVRACLYKNFYIYVFHYVASVKQFVGVEPVGF